MDFKVLPFFKSHYSLGKSILTLEKPHEAKKGEEDKDENKIHPDSIIEICKENGMDKFFLIDDNISGFLQGKINAEDNDLQMIFGIRLTVLDDASVKEDESKKKESKIILIAKNAEGYKDLVKIWSDAARDGFYYTPRTDKKKLERLCSDNIMCVVPFYDSFLYNNNFKMNQCNPDWLYTFKPENVRFAIEDNDLPFDDLLRDIVVSWVDAYGHHEIIDVKSIYYKDRKDLIPYATFRCIHNRSILSRPNLDHFCSNEFSFEAWRKQNEN